MQEPKLKNGWYNILMLKTQRGIAHLFLIVLVVVVLAVVGLLVSRRLQQQSSTDQEQQSSVAQADPNQPPLKLKGIGIDLGYYDQATGKAGDVVFTKAPLKGSFGLLFSDYGFVIPASSSATGANKANPQPTFILPMGTKVRSLVDGVVVNIPKLYSGDYSIQIGTDANSQWLYETEHVLNPVVKVGDRVTAGQVIAEVSSHDSNNNNGYGLVEIGILKGGNPPQHVCPFAYLDDSIKDETLKKLTALYKSWEDYRGDSSLYNEAGLKIPGCLSLDPIEG